MNEIKKITDELDLLINEGTAVIATKWSPSDAGIISFSTYVNYEKYQSWRIKVLTYLKTILDLENMYIIEIEKFKEHNYSYAKTINELLTSLKQQIEKGIVAIEKTSPISSNYMDSLLLLFDRFHKIARQLRTRYSSRETLKISDEYDVQDLLHALLLLYFDDVRKEEWTPSYAGSCSRQDFLLKKEKVVIEVKKTRNSMTDRSLGEQLIIDIEKYKSHPDCERLICFVYDPEGILGNPEGIMNDLNSQNDSFAKIIVRP